MNIESFGMMDFNLLAFGPGPMELAIIAGVILLLFGSSKLPTLMRNLGRSTNEFKRGMSESSLDDEEKKSDSSEKS
jgi:sec-independent protein translocase protein TatA